MLTLTKRQVTECANMHETKKIFHINKVFTGNYNRIQMESPDGSDNHIDVMIPIYTEELTFKYTYEKFDYDLNMNPNQTINITSFQVRGERKVLAIWLKLNGVLSGLALPPIDADSDIYMIRVPSLYIDTNKVSVTKFQLSVYCETNDDIKSEPEITMFHSGTPYTESQVATHFIHLDHKSNFEFHFDEMFMSDDFPITYHYPDGQPKAKPYRVEDELFMDI